MALSFKKCSVKGKIEAIYETTVIKNEQSSKRKGQPFKVVTTECLKERFLENKEAGHLQPTLKIDGTSCLIDEFNGRPWLWARHDVKPNKIGDKKFKAWKEEMSLHVECPSEEAPVLDLDLESDFKEFPDDWRSATGSTKENATPSDNGHLVGWVPVDPSLRNHLWHLSVVNLSTSHGLVTKYNKEIKSLTVSIFPLKDLVGNTFELIGTNVNANPYGLGSKKAPVHLLIQHGEIPITISDKLHTYSQQELNDWFASENGQSEGIIWHSTQNNDMFKVHRHHLQQRWPVPTPVLVSFPVSISLGDNDLVDSVSGSKKSLFSQLKELNGQTLQSLRSIDLT